MACSEWEELFSEFYDRTLRPEQERRVREHLDGCSSCRREFEVFTESIDALHGVGSVTVDEAFERRVVRALGKPTEPLAIHPWRSWFRYAAAAGLAFAFGLGYWIQGRASREKIRRLEAQVHASGSGAVEKKEIPPSPSSDDLVRQGILDWVQEHDLVEFGGKFVSREDASRLMSGYWRVGNEWLHPEKDRDILAKACGMEAKTIIQPSTAQGMTTEQMAEKLGLVKCGAGYVERSWMEKFEDGLVMVSPGSFVLRESIEQEFMARHGLKHYQGLIMNESHIALLEAQQRLQKPAGASSNEVVAALDGLMIGQAVTYGDVTVYPIVSQNPSAPSLISLHQALAKGPVEILDEGALSVQVRNLTDHDLLIVAGEILVGPRLERVVAEDVVVLRHKAAIVNTYDVDFSTYVAKGKFDRECGHSIAPASIRFVLDREIGQGAVWSRVDAMMRFLEVKRPSVHDANKQLSIKLDEVRRELVDRVFEDPAVVGMVIGIGEAIEEADVFSNHALAVEQGEKIVEAAVLESLVRKQGGKPSVPSALQGVGGAKHILERVFLSKPYPSGETGIVLRREETGVGRAVVREGRLIHGHFLPEGLVWEHREPWVGDKPARDKLARILEEYEARIRKAGPLRRSALVREMASIPGSEVTLRLLAHLGDREGGVRSTVLTCLGDRRDPRALPDLLRGLDRNRIDKETFRPWVNALARMGDEAAVEPLMKLLDGRDSREVLQAVVEELPALLLGIRNAELLEKAVGKLVVLQGYSDAVVKGATVSNDLSPQDYQILLGSLQECLSAITSREFATAAECERWWNLRENRQEFLRRRGVR